MKKILFLILSIVLFGCKPVLVTNYKVESKTEKKTYYTNEIHQTSKLDSLVFSEFLRNGEEVKYKVAVNDVRVFEKIEDSKEVKPSKSYGYNTKKKP